MKAETERASNVDHYISGFSAATQKALNQVRATIKKAVPKAEEVISYNMPAYKYHGMLVYFAGYARHVGFYPMPDVIVSFKKELSIYKSAKGSVQFPLDQPMPLKLITQMVKFRALQNVEKEKRQGGEEISYLNFIKNKKWICN